MITEDYCSFEVAKLLKEKGFNGQCRAAYTNYGKLFTIQIQQYVTNVLCSKGKLWDCAAPTFQMAMKWLREVHYLHITVHPGISEYGFVWTYAIVLVKEVGKGETHFYKISQITTPIVKSKSYEQACETAIKYCLENLI